MLLPGAHTAVVPDHFSMNRHAPAVHPFRRQLRRSYEADPNTLHECVVRLPVSHTAHGVATSATAVLYTCTTIPVLYSCKALAGS